MLTLMYSYVFITVCCVYWSANTRNKRKKFSFHDTKSHREAQAFGTIFAVRLSSDECKSPTSVMAASCQSHVTKCPGKFLEGHIHSHSLTLGRDLALGLLCLSYPSPLGISHHGNYPGAGNIHSVATVPKGNLHCFLKLTLNFGDKA